MKQLILVTALIILTSSDLYSQNKVDSKSAEELCQSVSKINELPRDWGQKGVDKTYDSIVDAGDVVVPCLINNITNTKVMKDPRCPTISTATTVGDISYFILVDLLKLNFVQLLPDDVKQSYKTNGVYAYHEYIDKKGSRKELQQKLRKWYSEHKGK